MFLDNYLKFNLLPIMYIMLTKYIWLYLGNNIINVEMCITYIQNVCSHFFYFFKIEIIRGRETAFLSSL